MRGTGSPCPTVCRPLWGIWSGQICLPTSKDSFWVLVVWCEELAHHVPLFVDLCEEYDQARYVYLPLRTVSGSWWCGVRNWSTMSHCLLNSVRNMIRPDMFTHLLGQFLGPGGMVWGTGPQCPTVDLCEEYDPTRYVYTPLRTVSGSWWYVVRNWSTMSHCWPLWGKWSDQLCLHTS